MPGGADISSYVKVYKKATKLEYSESMARPLKDIEQELLTLPRKERADIVLRVIRSLDEGHRGRAWTRIGRKNWCAATRILNQGKAKLIPAEEVFEKARKPAF